MKLMATVAILSVVVGGCATASPPESEAVLSAFVYDVDPDPSDPNARQLGLNVDACNGDYEVAVDETIDRLGVEVLNYEPGEDECVDSFTVHLDSPPHGKAVVDLLTNSQLNVTVEPVP
jgi:hypothetical protein